MIEFAVYYILGIQLLILYEIRDKEKLASKGLFVVSILWATLALVGLGVEVIETIGGYLQ